MGEPLSSNDEFNIYQESISQFPFLNGYTHFVRVFEVSQTTPRQSLVAALQDAFDQVKAKIPWLDGHVRTVDGVMKSVPWPRGARANCVRRKDADDLLPSFADIMTAGGPISMFPGDVLTPWPALPAPHGITDDLVPVAVLTAVFIRGGLILVVTTHHVLFDAAAIFTLWDLLATVMNGNPDPIPAATVVQANRDRTRVIPLLRPNEPCKDFSHLLRPADFVPRAPPPTRWCVFRIPLAKIAELKADIGGPGSVGWDPAVRYISRNDALSAFAWQRICAVRIANGRAGSRVSKFGRAVDMRPALDIPKTYMGQMIGHAATRLPLQEVAIAPLARLACLLRRDLAEARTAWVLRSYATFVARTPKERLLYGGVYDAEVDVGASSIYRMEEGYRPMRMGVLGTSRMFRKPDAISIPSCMYFFPSDNERDMQLMLCMTSDDLAGLVRDPEWSKYIECVDIARATRGTPASE
ncbi:hypothetical protein EV356DRAFT_94821 [Viridothelium virens]|uniref:Trichothecene 3-O-acetyltransferase-like N-terminal domain-containing protein n=1 Tax=Viridothelium virens TaxID=1048519 RepID=A0A6A6HCL0_VIRVR|nr:hypothetical protein EV356DRAFT_94821 [Viridothelium virens]